MTRTEIQQFKDLFHQYYRQEIAANHCVADGCDLCPVNQAYAEIFAVFLMWSVLTMVSKTRLLFRSCRE